MKAVQVTYTTTADYAAQNQRNIQQVIADLQHADHPGIFYHVCLQANGRTFIHSAFFQTSEDEQILLTQESFKDFQQQLKASSPEVSPRQEIITLVGSTKNLF